jgi:hypothetical protein
MTAVGRWLRLSDGVHGLVSARTFEDAFTGGLHEAGVLVERGRLEDLLDVSSILGPRSVAGTSPTIAAAADQFARATADYDVICPDYEHLATTPMLMALRNVAQSDVSFCFIAHSPAVYALDFALLSRLITPRDAIVAPTPFARDVIAHLNVDLAGHVEIIAHPLPRDLLTALERAPNHDGDSTTLLTLSRITPTKLVHRQIDALAMLTDRGRADIDLCIAGPTNNPKTGRPTPYASALRAQARRLGISSRVTLAGDVQHDEKAALLRSCAGVVNLSVTLEESYGKTVAEARCAGVPVVVTRWDGLPDVAGPDAFLVDVRPDQRTGDLDIDPAELADAMAAATDSRRADREHTACARAAVDPRAAGTAYRRLMDQHRRREPAFPDTSADLEDPTVPAAPSAGLLASTAPVPLLSWGQLFSMYVTDLPAHVPSLADFGSTPGSRGIRSLLNRACASPLESRYRHDPWAPEHSLDNASTDTLGLPGDLSDLTAHALDIAAATTASQFTCIMATDKSQLPSDLELVRRHFDDSGLRAIAVAAHTEAYDEALTRCVGLLDELNASSYLVLKPLARISLHLNRPNDAVALVRGWVESHPDHFATYDLLADLIELIALSDQRAGIKEAQWAACAQRLNELVEDPDERQKIVRRVAHHRLAELFG